MMFRGVSNTAHDHMLEVAEESGLMVSLQAM